MAEPPFLQALIKSVNFYGRFAPSFTRIGYVARGIPFRPVRADYTGQLWLITGATGGLGRAAALRAVRKGATVHAVGRNAAALESLQSAAAGAPGRIVPVLCDLSSMRAVSDMTRRPEMTGLQFDVLVNNVGLLMRAYAATAEGLETSYATNLLGHYILTEQLHAEGRLKPGAAVINVVSGGLYNLPLNKSMLNIPEEKFNGFAAYAAHKRAQLALAEYWRASFADIGARTYAVHPGWADTAGVKTSLPRFRKILAPILRNDDEGADTIDWLAATRPAEVVDEIWFDRKPRTAHAYPHTRNPRTRIADVVAFLERDRQALTA
ncbi:SDR family NAD(P)-dependent oxidoreductase [Brevundimonas sp. FT23042]|uniref:SDR family NAD(P)-dependent oxidoreductase n=1 Tax=Brevundimonas sp. FT23042 TaxID=3393749 RepID=UPI003B58AF0D